MMYKDSAALLKTKFYVPPRRPDLVSRPRLMAILSGAQQHLTLVSARAGAGKTTLVSEWLHQQKCHFAWLSLDENDNEPRRFFAHLAEAFRRLEILIDPDWLNGLAGPELPQVDQLMSGWINEITAGQEAFILVLDDYHLQKNEWIHRAIAFLVEHQPPSMQLVLITREDPPWPLAHLRARGWLREVRDDDLRFTREETTAFLNGVMQLDLPPNALTTIEGRTEGWIAGLQMAAISARGHKQKDDLDAFIETFGGTNRFILDYLLEEVLNQQPPAVQDFLIETSILERMCADLCDSVRAAPDSLEILNHLERANLFVIQLDDERHWYRYHHLFADLLQSVLRQRKSTGQIKEYHQRAGCWYQSQHLLVEAMTHSLSAGDFERAASMIDENITGMLNLFSPNHDLMVLAWIEKLPESVRRSRPWIDIYRANLLALSLKLDGVDEILDDAEARIDPASPRTRELRAYLAVVRAYAANLRGNASESTAMAEQASQLIGGEENLIGQVMIAFVKADTLFALDDMPGATQALSNLLRLGERLNLAILIVPTLHNLASVRCIQGQLHQAEETYKEAYQVLVDRNALDSRVRCSYEFGMADLLRERNLLEAARQHALTGIEVRRRQGAYRVIGDLALMRVLQALGDSEGALMALREAETFVQSYSFQLALMIEFKTWRVRQWLAVGDVETAARWAAECNGGSEPEQIALARLLLAQGRPAEAQALLVRQRSLAEQGKRTGRVIEILALLALALEAQGLRDVAEEALGQALMLARPEGYLRTFLDLGVPLYELLRRVAAPAGSFEGALLDAFRQVPSAGRRVLTAPIVTANMPETLSERELNVLRLVGEGLSNKEIAVQLFVAPSTIKQHLKNICRKLDVHGRMQAVRRGQELNLI